RAERAWTAHPVAARLTSIGVVIVRHLTLTLDLWRTEADWCQTGRVQTPTTCSIHSRRTLVTIKFFPWCPSRSPQNPTRARFRAMERPLLQPPDPLTQSPVSSAPGTASGSPA